MARKRIPEHGLVCNSLRSRVEARRQLLQGLFPSLESSTVCFLGERCNCAEAHNHRGILMKLIAAGTLALALAANIAQPRQALAWGDDGHKVVALIAQSFLQAMSASGSTRC